MSTGGGGSGGDPDPSGQNTVEPAATTSKQGDTIADQPIDQTQIAQDILEKAFSQEIRDDIFNMLIVGLTRHSHMLLYSEDPWSEGYTIPFLANMASKVGAYVHAIDIPDLALLTSWIDPVFEDLTIVSHPYSPPPDLDPGSHSSSNGSRMSFFAGIDRKRFHDEGDTMSEQVDNRSEETEAARDEESEFPEDEGDRNSERAAAAALFGRSGTGIGRGHNNDSITGNDAEAGEPVLSREMMTNPLSRDATERLDSVLAKFVASMFDEQLNTQPRILVIKNLGDLLNTRIGYTLFSRLMAVVKKQGGPDSQPAVVVGLMHPSIFHQDTPPPGIPPFDINPSAPNALIPNDSQTRAPRHGLGGFLDSLVGGGGSRGTRGPNSSIGVKIIQMGGGNAQSEGSAMARSPLGAFDPRDIENSDTTESLPLFSRVGIPPPNQSVFARPYDMSPFDFTKQEPDSGGATMVGSLRQLLNAEQCLERNARTIRNVCLLYRVPGLALSDGELALTKAQTQTAQKLQKMNNTGKFATNLKSRKPLPEEEGEDKVFTPEKEADNLFRQSENVYRRESLYEVQESETALLWANGKELWGLDYRPLVTMLRSLPDDIARRFFIGETFVHRWISLAQALAVREKVEIGKGFYGLQTPAKAARYAFLESRHLKRAWIQALQASMALRQGYDATANETEEKVTETNEPNDDGSSGSILALHEQVDFADIGIGRKVEDDMELDPDMSGLQSKVSASEITDTAEKTASDPGVETLAALPSKTSEFKQWASISDELDAETDEDGADSSDFGNGKGKHAGTALSPQKRIQMAKKSLSDYEERLVGSIVDPTSIPTGFSQVCVKEETVTTLQEIITLPMLRPEYFSKGVLRRYGVSGILLFGPPGTGKTMLAKAVAKESGSVVLNIRASDIYDKYVGEGEKLAEAVFTLARKVAPCVIFIDEVDALFSARSTGENNKFRRDIMNQIMSEWDGINTSRKRGTAANTNGSSPPPPPQVMVMAATNRPFDLDDAILRRLPRRILIDLPNTEERARILAIHLQGENLEQDVDLKALAQRADSFSGSDLKNLCVAAALAALRERVREEVAGNVGAAVSEHQPKAPEKKEKQEVEPKDSGSDQLGVSLIEQLKTTRHLRPGTGADGRKMPPIKLGSRHFDAALKKVAPSSSDRMESLVELRKWDKLYGDGAQERRRKSSSIGFAGAEEATTGAAVAAATKQQQQDSNGSSSK
ncbi:hypothetical protein EV175_004600, partial [Coemansia sp. RSA 1933]